MTDVLSDRRTSHSPNSKISRGLGGFSLSLPLSKQLYVMKNKRGNYIHQFKEKTGFKGYVDFYNDGKRIILRELQKKKVEVKGIKLIDLVQKHAELYGYDLNRFKRKDGYIKYKRYIKAICRARVKDIILPELEKSEYKEYLRSKNWKQIRSDIITERGKCERCGSKEHLQVHHKTYKNIFNELPTDLEVLCSRCHKKHHFA